MNPNTTISYMATQAKQRQMEHRAERGWLAEQAAGHRESRKIDVVFTFTRLIGIIGTVARLLVAKTTATASFRLVRRGLSAR